MDVYLCGPSSRTAALWSLPMHQQYLWNGVESLFTETLLCWTSVLDILASENTGHDLCHILTMLYMAFSAQCPYLIFSSASWSLPDSAANLQQLHQEKKNDEFSALFCSFTRSPMYINIHDQFPCWIIHLSLCITHTSSFITETIAIKKFLWWGTQKRGWRAPICISTAIATSKAFSGAYPCYGVGPTCIFAQCLQKQCQKLRAHTKINHVPLPFN